MDGSDDSGLCCCFQVVEVSLGKNGGVGLDVVDVDAVLMFECRANECRTSEEVAEVVAFYACLLDCVDDE